MTPRKWLQGSLAALGLALVAAAAAQQPAATPNVAPAPPKGEAVDGLQLSLDIGSNSENITATQSLLFLGVGIRNVSAAPIQLDLDRAAYDFEYEIDGTWYAYERMSTVRTTRDDTLARIPSLRKSAHTIAAGSSTLTFLILPLADIEPALRLHPVAADGGARYFEPTPGPHVIRVRPGSVLLEGRQAPISTAATINFRMPVRTAAHNQTVSFSSSRGTPLQELRFAHGPADGEALVRGVLRRPPEPQHAPRLFSAVALENTGALPYYELRLPRTRSAPDPTLPAELSRYYYAMQAGNQVAGYIAIQSSPTGSFYVHMNGLDSYHGFNQEFRALQDLSHLAGMRELRGGNYEPRMLQVIGAQGAVPLTLTVFWLHSTSGQRDLFYRPLDPDFTGKTAMESRKLYSTSAFLKAVQELPVKPMHDEKWAVTAARVCAERAADAINDFISPERAKVELELGKEQDHVVWYVYIPGLIRLGISPELGREWLVDDRDGTCQGAGRARD